MSFVTMPQVLQVIGLAPNKHGRKTAVEDLRAVKSLFPMFGVNKMLPPQMQQMLDSVMKGDVASMIQNPMAAVTGALQGQLGNIAGQLANIPGAGGMIAALTGGAGLQGAMGSLLGTASSLVGLPGGIGNFDLNSVMGHAALGALGELPAAMGLDRVIAPVMEASGVLDRIGATLDNIEHAIANGGDIGAHIADVLNHVADVNGLVNGSIDALTQGLQLTQGVSAFSIIAEGLDPLNTDNPLLDFFQAIVLPEAQAAIAAHHEQMALEAPIRSGRNADGTIDGYTPPEGLEEP